MSKPAISAINWDDRYTQLCRDGLSETEAKAVIQSEKYELVFKAEIEHTKELSAKELSAKTELARVEVKEKEQKTMRFPVEYKNGRYERVKSSTSSIFSDKDNEDIEKELVELELIVELELAAEREQRLKAEREQSLKAEREQRDRQVAEQLSRMSVDELLAQDLSNFDDGVGSLYPVLQEGWR